MKKYFVSFVFLVVFGGFAALHYISSASAANAGPSYTGQVTEEEAQQAATLADSDTATDTQPAEAQPTPAQTAPEPAPKPKPKPTPAPTPMPVAKPKGEYNDGTYTGSVADAFYGNIQVKATVSGGKLTNVTFLQYPNDRSTSVMINQQAMPGLVQEALQAQSASVNGVSGAMQTSEAFRASLGAALAQAKA